MGSGLGLVRAVTCRATTTIGAAAGNQSLPHPQPGSRCPRVRAHSTAFANTSEELLLLPSEALDFSAARQQGRGKDTSRLKVRDSLPLTHLGR